MGTGATGKFRKKLTMSVLAGALAVAWGGSALAEFCARSTDHSALSSRVMQSEIMVAALTCGERPRYNMVVRKFERELVQHGYALRRLFERSYGRQANRHLNRFVTAMANDASQRSLTDESEFCAASAQLFDRLLTMSPHEFEVFAASETFAAKHGVRSCRRQISAVSDR